MTTTKTTKDEMSARFEAISKEIKIVQSDLKLTNAHNEVIPLTALLTNLLQEREVLKEKLQKIVAESDLVIGEYWVNHKLLSIMTIEHISPEGMVELTYAHDKSMKTHSDVFVLYHTKLEKWIEMNGYCREY